MYHGLPGCSGAPPAGVARTCYLAASNHLRTATMLSLFHNHDASALTLLWSVGTVVLFVGLGSLVGPRLLVRSAPR